jgi:hypothetical protein
MSGFKYFSLAESSGQWTRLAIQDSLKTADNVGGDHSGGIKCNLRYAPSMILEELKCIDIQFSNGEFLTVLIITLLCV